MAYVNKSSLQRNRQTVLHEIIFEADTPAGKAFDIALIISILLSVIAVMMESVTSIREAFGFHLYVIEWIFTIGFTIEYILRLLCVGKPLRYARSFFGIVDLLAVIPTYVGLFFPSGHYLMVIRVLRVLRTFRILKLAHHIGEARLLMDALKASRTKITVFVFTVMTIVVIVGSIMYIVEGEENGYTSIPRSIYWAIVTLTTVGYGDISPGTNLGQAIASLVMIMGYAIIAVPTGIVTAEISQQTFRQRISTQACPECSLEGHDSDAIHCKFCGAGL
ncbi:MAG: ion transporter [Deltaproteobacteria bacterium]|nr:ion transporter [Deltaproteobacteria bacterium]